MTHRSRLFAVCCVVSNEIADKLLTATDYDAPSHALVVIDSLDKTYREASRPPIGSIASPFKGKDTEECCKLIREMTERTQSDINHRFLAILDEQSSEDSSALLAVSFEGEDVQSVRATFDSVNFYLLAISAKGIILDLQETASTEPNKTLRLPRTLPPNSEAVTHPNLAPRKQLKRGD